MEKLDFRKVKMDAIVFCDNCGKKLIFTSFYRNFLNITLCKKCYRRQK